MKQQRFNKWYNNLDWDAKAVFQNTFSKIYREEESSLSTGTWMVSFCGKPIQMPLSREQAWLDWDNAVSILGHDPDVKMTYENLLKSNRPVKCFFDVGANYGTHSLLFLSQGVHTVSFEPNFTIIPKLEEMCRINQLHAKVENLALGETAMSVQFQFPAKETWLGRIVTGDNKPTAPEKDMQSIDVKVVTLDSYVAEKNDYPDLIKIDTEGNEIHVLRGARQLIDTRKPLIIFESNTPDDRDLLWDYFAEVKYRICALPFSYSATNAIQSLQDFKKMEAYNFIAVPEVVLNSQTK